MALKIEVSTGNLAQANGSRPGQPKRYAGHAGNR
jgi:hypothetical protein